MLLLAHYLPIEKISELLLLVTKETNWKRYILVGKENGHTSIRKIYVHWLNAKGFSIDIKKLH